MKTIIENRARSTPRWIPSLKLETGRAPPPGSSSAASQFVPLSLRLRRVVLGPAVSLVKPAELRLGDQRGAVAGLLDIAVRGRPLAQRQLGSVFVIVRNVC